MRSQSTCSNLNAFCRDPSDRLSSVAASSDLSTSNTQSTPRSFTAKQDAQHFATAPPLDHVEMLGNYEDLGDE
eukprot:3181107-Rhodomonas_salina.2